MSSTIGNSVGYFFDPLGLSEPRDWENTAAQVAVTFASFLVGIATLGALHGAYACYAAINSSPTIVPNYESIREGTAKGVTTTPNWISNLQWGPNELTPVEREEIIDALGKYIQAVESGKSEHTLPNTIFNLKTQLDYFKTYHKVSALVKNPSENSMINEEEVASKRAQIKSLSKLNSILKDGSFSEHEKWHCCRLGIGTPGPIVGVDQHGVYLDFDGQWDKSSDSAFVGRTNHFFRQYAAEGSERIYFNSLRGLMECIQEIPDIKPNPWASIDNFCTQHASELAKI